MPAAIWRVGAGGGGGGEEQFAACGTFAAGAQGPPQPAAGGWFKPFIGAF